MDTTLRVLIVADSEIDVPWIVRHMERAGCAPIHERVATAAEMETALQGRDWDLVIADHNLPRLDALSALRLLQENHQSVPLIVLSDAIGEDAAVAMIEAGAQDFVLKHHPAQLIFAARRALSNVELCRERRRAEEALRQSEEQYRTIPETIEESYIETDLTGSLRFFNPAACRMLGYSSEELRDTHLKELMDQETAQRIKQVFEGVYQTGRAIKSLEYQLTRKDGTHALVESSLSLIRDTGGKPIGFRGIGRDITERKRAQELLLEERERLATVLDGNPLPTFMIDQGHRIVFWNRAIETFTGVPRERALGHTPSESLSEVYQGKPPPILADLILELPDEEILRRHGHKIRRAGFGEAFEVTNPLWPKGSKSFLEILATRIRDHQGALVGVLQCGQDVTDKVHLRNRLQHTQKMEALGTLAGGVAHDFNNILTAILGFTQLARDQVSGGNAVRRYLDQVFGAGSRAADLVRQILTFSRWTEQERKPVEVPPIITEALKLLRSSLPTTIEIHQEIAIEPQDGMVLTDPTQIHQVMMNLCSNAAHAMRTRGGVLGVSLSQMEVTRPLVARYPDLKPGPYLQLTVSDTGHGMDAELMERIFDPYFTTKGLGEGTGLGLAVVQGIVKSCGGVITVYSEPGQGTTFNLFLPKIQCEFSLEAEAAEESALGSERILFVDDEKALVELGKEMLETMGYRVVAKTSSMEALSTFRAQPPAFDLVITDMTMPGLTGAELAQELLAIRSDLPIILCTGFSGLINGPQCKAIGIREFVMKPYVSTSLAKTIRKALQQN
jgi:two-component system, cell cycle sensor histidine kinase and response regulator CckA